MPSEMFFQEDWRGGVYSWIDLKNLKRIADDRILNLYGNYTGEKQPLAKRLERNMKCGGPREDRTPNPLIKSQDYIAINTFFLTTYPVPAKV